MAGGKNRALIIFQTLIPVILIFQMMKSRLRKFKLLAWSCISVKSWNKNLNPNLSVS